MKKDIVITLDTDWANDHILEFCVNLLEKHGIKAVFFSTNKSKVLDSLNEKNFEIGLHPNFFNSLDDFEKPVYELKSIYPNALGGRSHGLFCSSNILSIYKKYGLKYESNNFLYLHPNLQPTLRFEEFHSIPFFWSDDKFLENNKNPNTFHLEIEGLKVYNFHPIHIYMNSPNYSFYQANKIHYHDHKILKKNRFKGYGMLNYFIDLLIKISEEERESTLLTNLL